MGLKEQCHLVRIFSAHNNKISEIVWCLKYSLEALYSKLYATKLFIFLHIICESASRIRHIGLENLKNYCRSFSSLRAKKRCAPGDAAPLILYFLKTVKNILFSKNCELDLTVLHCYFPV
jgi:hypothetical protein